MQQTSPLGRLSETAEDLVRRSRIRQERTGNGLPRWLVVAGGGRLCWLVGGGSRGAASRDVTYTETTPTRQDVSNSLSGTGTLNPANTYTVKSLVDGKILTSDFEEGDKVEEGDVLYTIDSSDASTNLEKASIALQQAQRSYDKTVDRQYRPR